jgi:hypothetical protein
VARNERHWSRRAWEFSRARAPSPAVGRSGGAGSASRAPAIAYEVSARRERGGRSPDAAPRKFLTATGMSRMVVSASATIAIRIGMS